MDITFKLILPAYYTHPKNKIIEYNLKNSLQTIFSNNVWERKFHYGYGLKNFHIDKLKDARIKIFPAEYYALPKEDLITYLKEILKEDFDEKILETSDLIGSKGLVSIEIQTSPEKIENLGNDGIWDESHTLYNIYSAVTKELSALFRASVHLFFHCDYIIAPSLKDLEKINGGFYYLKFNGNSKIFPYHTQDFTFPVILMENHINELNDVISLLSTKWHLNLWPIRRMIKALKSEFIDMENFLDLLFALEGLYEKNVSSDFIKLSCSLLTSDNPDEAKKTLEVLDLAFKMRNEIVHGSVEYTGMEKIKFEGKETLSQKIFWKLKRIVAKSIFYTLIKLNNQKEMKNLKITKEDIINKFYMSN